jgi:hypothetical protein
LHAKAIRNFRKMATQKTPEILDSNGNVARKMKENPERVYICSMERPLKFPMHVWNRLWLGVAHLFGIHGTIMMVFGLVPRTVFFPSKS